jgi:hypothetical protein
MASDDKLYVTDAEKVCNDLELRLSRDAMPWCMTPLTTKVISSIIHGSGIIDHHRSLASADLFSG